MVCVNTKSIYVNIEGKLTNDQGKLIDPLDIGNCLNELDFVKSIAIQRSSTSSSSPLTIYLLIKESNQGSKLTLGKLINLKLEENGFNCLGSIEIYGLPMFPQLVDSKSPSIDWEQLNQLQSHRFQDDPLVKGERSISEVEKDIIGCWSKYLKIPPNCINCDDNLFQLGGNLFIAGRVGHYLYGKNYPITIEMIIDNPTVKGLADCIGKIKSGKLIVDSYKPIVRLDEVDSNGERKSLLSWTQRWVFIHEQLLGKGYCYYLDVSYQIDGRSFDYPTIESTLNQLIDQVDLLRSFVRTRGSGHYLTIASSRKLSIPIIKVTSDGEAREQINRKKETLNIISGDETFLFDVIFIETPEVNCYTLFIHHLIVDDWSYLLLEEKLFQLLQSRVTIKSFNGRQQANHKSSHKLPSIDYVDYSIWVTREVQQQSTIIDPLEDYWLDRLKDLPNCLIPVNYDENNLPNEPKLSGKHFLISLSEDETNGAKSLVRSVGTTLDILTEAVVKVALYKLTGVRDTIIKRIVSARLHPVSYEMIGHFNNMIYSRTVINPDEKFTTILRNFHSSWLTDFKYRGHSWINMVAQTNVEHIHPAGISIIGLPDQRFVDDDSLPVKIFKVDQFTQVSFELVTCIFGLHEGKLHYCLNYNEDLLSPQVIDSLVSTFEIFLKRVVTYSDRPIDDYFNIQPIHLVTQWPQELENN